MSLLSTYIDYIVSVQLQRGRPR